MYFRVRTLKYVHMYTCHTCTLKSVFSFRTSEKYHGQLEGTHRLGNTVPPGGTLRDGISQEVNWILKMLYI
jgi:hypothetical protein